MVYPHVTEKILGSSPHVRSDSRVELHGAAAVEQAVRLIGAEALETQAVLVTPAAEHAGQVAMQQQVEYAQAA